MSEGVRATVVVPVLNEQADIEECLDCLRRQTISDIEILVADGGSSDHTREIVRRIAGVDGRVRLLENPGQLQAAGLNICLSEARSPVLIRMDGHAFAPADYLEKCLRLLDETGAAVVGGRMAARPLAGVVAEAIALINEAPWGAGPARFHRSGGAGPAETVYLGAFRTEVARKIGGWAVDVGVNEDYEFNHRVRQSGEVVWFDPTLRVDYRPRSNAPGLLKQYFRYGLSKATVMTRHPDSVRMRQLAPLALAPCLLSAVFIRRRPVGRVGALVIAGHTSTVCVGAAVSRQGRDVRCLAAVLAVAMHHAWSVGAWIGLLRFRELRRHGGPLQ